MVMARAKCALLLAAAALMCAAAASEAAAALRPLPSNYHLFTPGRYKRNQQLMCTEPKNRPGCMAKCEDRCPSQCIVLCPGCKTYCICDFYPGMSCGDPRFTGGDGNNFYFHGTRDRDFCILSDAGLHINAHFIGKRGAPGMRRDFTWIQALGVRLPGDHRLYVGAQRTARWDGDVDRLDLAFDGAPIHIRAEPGAAWESAAVPMAGGLTVTRTASANGVRVRLEGVFDIVANVVPVSEEESRVHGYGVAPEEDSLAHLDLGFKFLGLTDDVHGVLGQTNRSDYVNQLSVSSKMPVMGEVPKYLVSDIFATDCAVARFRDSHTAAAISMLTIN